MRANAGFRICIFLLLKNLLNEVEHTFWRLVITCVLICAPLFGEHKLPPLLITTKTHWSVLQDSLTAEQCKGATRAFHFEHEKAKFARQTVCIEILDCWCLASWCRDYCICLTVNSLRKSIGIPITERDFEDDEDLSYLKCQWLLNCISYF